MVSDPPTRKLRLQSLQAVMTSSLRVQASAALRCSPLAANRPRHCNAVVLVLQLFWPPTTSPAEMSVAPPVRLSVPDRRHLRKGSTGVRPRSAG